MALTVNEGIATLLRERMLLFDPEVDTAVGSRFDRVVVTPLMARLGPDPTDTDALQLVIDRVRAYDANYSTEPGSGIRDILINPLAMILEPYRRIAHTIVTRGSWENIEQLTESEADIKSNNIFYARDAGGYATGSLRLKFTTPRGVVVTSVNIARAGALRFIPTRTQTITATKMATQTSGSYYYFDILVTSENPGDEYNLPAGSVNSIDSVSGCVGIEQLYDFIDGRARQTNVELKAAAELAITVRNLVNNRSIQTVLPDADHFPAIDRMEIVGRMDPAMERDLVRGGTNLIAGIPQGVKGSAAPDIVIGGAIHIGGFTDIWIHATGTDSDVEESVDILSVADEGLLVCWSATGDINSATPRRLYDTRLWFTETDGSYMPVLVGDYIIVQGLLDGTFQHQEFDITTVADGYVDVDPGGPILSAVDLTDVSYEVRRRVSGYIHLSLDTLVAEDSDGPLLTSTGDPYLPAPGRELESEGYAATKNVAASNVSLPLFYISKLDILNNTFSPAEVTGEIVPEADPIVYYIVDRVAETKVWVRAIYRYPTRFAPLYGTKFYTLGADEYYTAANVPAASYTFPVTLTAADEVLITWVGVKTYAAEYPSREVRVGDYLQVTTVGGDILVSPIIALDFGAPGNVKVAESIFPTTPAAIADVRFLQGATYAEMDSGILTPPIAGQDDMGFYYYDFIAERAGTLEQEIGTTLATPPPGGIYSQGWRVSARLEGYSFSTLEEPLLEITEFINDTLDITSTSPTNSNHFRVTYYTTPFVAEVQSFLDSGDEYIPSEDMLVRRMVPARVHTAIKYLADTVTGSPTESVAVAALRESIANVGSGLSATALSNVVEELGAYKVTYPFSVIVEYSGKSRSGKNHYGNLMSFHGYDGCILPEGAVGSIVSLYRMAQFIPGSVVAVEES